MNDTGEVLLVVKIDYGTLTEAERKYIDRPKWDSWGAKEQRDYLTHRRQEIRAHAFFGWRD